MCVCVHNCQVLAWCWKLSVFASPMINNLYWVLRVLCNILIGIICILHLVEHLNVFRHTE